MSEEVRRRIFEPFFSTRSPLRTGLGLSVVHGIVAGTAGRMEVTSEEGRSTTVRVWLPAARRRSAAAPRRPAPRRPPCVRRPRAHPGRPVSSSSRTSRRSARCWSTRSGAPAIDVEFAADGLAGLARFQGGEFDVVLTDLSLPERSGLDVARAVKRMRPGTPVVLITGWGHLLDPALLVARAASTSRWSSPSASSACSRSSTTRSVSAAGLIPPPGSGHAPGHHRPRHQQRAAPGRGYRRRHGWRVVEEAQRVTRLGESQAATGALGPVPMARTAATVADYVRRAEALGATRVRVTATSAVREAANRAEFVALVESVDGTTLEVLSGEDEARLTLLGARSGLPDLAGRFVLFDIGGGSTEFVVAEGDRLERALSLRLGVVGLAERYVDGGAAGSRALGGHAGGVAAALAPAVPGALGVGNATRLVGTAGTVTTLAALDLGLAAYDQSRVQGHVLRRDAIERLLARLGALTLAARAALPCLEPGRADVLIPGIAICLAVMERLGFDALTVSDRSLREGVLCEILAARGAAPDVAPRSPTMMRAFLLALSSRPALGRALDRMPLARRLVRRFVAGTRLADGLDVVRGLNAQGLDTALTYLGENVRSVAAARAAADVYVEALDVIARDGLRCTPSLKLTQLGLDLGDEVCVANMRRILERAHAARHPRLDRHGAERVHRAHARDLGAAAARLPTGRLRDPGLSAPERVGHPAPRRAGRDGAALQGRLSGAVRAGVRESPGGGRALCPPHGPPPRPREPLPGHLSRLRHPR